MRSLIGYILALIVILLLLMVFKVGMLHQNLLGYDEKLGQLGGTSYSFIVCSGSDEPNARSICNCDIVIANPNTLESVALLLRRRGNAAGQEHTVTTELFLKRDGKENIKYFKFKVPAGSTFAWTINKKSAHGIIA